MKEREILYSQVSGTVNKLNGDHGWIDLEEPIDNNREIYFNNYDVQNQIILKPGQFVIFDVSQNNYGLIAINVTPIKKKFPALFFIMIFIVVIGLWLLFYSLFKSKLPLFSCRFSAYLIAINITTMGLYGYDKIIAIRNGKIKKILKENKIARLQGKNIDEVNAKITIEDLKARISERALHFFELLLGTPGAYLSQLLFRHKTRKLSFQVIFWLIILFQMIIITFSFIITTVLKQTYYIVLFSVYILSIIAVCFNNSYEC